MSAPNLIAEDATTTSTRRRFIVCASAVTLGLAKLPSAVAGQKFTLKGSLFARVGSESNLDPYLLYAIALAESSRGVDKGFVSPWMYALRASKPHYPKTLVDAKEKLASILRTEGNLVDIGLMQINYRWNGHKVRHPNELLDPYTNLTVAADTLRAALRSSPSDLELGIGRYHHWENQARSLNYGQRVLAIRKNLIALS
ncbi:transglycosylase SLT domain-containing protein [Comamonas jiangduensis]|uniref:transglycosylase SLT domain-containing protein n=1 Tax=Comamonas jiangduensis TaxID=1194168 RepID=UPI003BF8854A